MSVNCDANDNDSISSDFSQCEDDDVFDNVSETTDDETDLFIWYVDDISTCIEIEEGVDLLLADYTAENISSFFKPWFYPDLIDLISLLAQDICVQFDVKVPHHKMKTYVATRAIEFFGNSIYPIRNIELCIPYMPPPLKVASISARTDIIAALNSVPTAPQRSPEWYAARHNMLTASNIGKLFGSPAERNSVILEKCMPPAVHGESGYPVNTRTSMHHGVKYEPVSAMLYNYIYGTKLGEFGCIRHPYYEYLGASPDGINIDPNSPLFGRMVEIKNIFNREITGIPTPIYWAQMQFQLEVCGLTECDFVETRICEYRSREECDADSTRVWRGVILQFAERGDLTYKPKYMYMPLASIFSMEQADQWIETEIDHQSTATPPLELVEIHYWFCDEFSCTCVQKNEVWIASAMPIITDTWNTILIERETGYAHRRPKSHQNDLAQLFAAQPSTSVKHNENVDMPSFMQGKIAVVKLN